MTGISEEEKSARVRNRRVHMANERTFLAWIRTSIAVMAFGFVVERFALFVRQISFILGKEFVSPPPGYSKVFGVCLVALGAAMGLLSFIRYRKVEKQIDEDAYRPSLILDVLLTLSILAIGILLIIYLMYSA